MKKPPQDYIVVTGAAGFIGSNIVENLNKKGKTNLILVDHMMPIKKKNLKNARHQEYYEKHAFLKKMEKGLLPKISVIIHMGACSDTREYDKDFLKRNNYIYSQKLFQFAVKNNCQFIYASSASVYGNGLKGYRENAKNLRPLNPYGHYKYLFDKWVLRQKKKPIQWVGLRFFNVYGPKEDHKEKMASVIYHGFNQLRSTGEIKLFKSYKKGYADGEQKRDFVFVEDITSVIDFFLSNPKKSGIFNLGTGKARTFMDLAKAVFKAMKKTPHIGFIEMPKILRKKYQYFTQADMHELKKIGYKKRFTSLEEGVEKYVKNYLLAIHKI